MVDSGNTVRFEYRHDLPVRIAHLCGLYGHFDFGRMMGIVIDEYVAVFHFLHHKSSFDTLKSIQSGIDIPGTDTVEISQSDNAQAVP